jgi:hypothetical protein
MRYYLLRRNGTVSSDATVLFYPTLSNNYTFIAGSLLRKKGDGINLHQKIGVCQCCDKKAGNCRRVFQSTQIVL